MNVFSGKNALKDFYNPEKCPPTAVSSSTSSEDTTTHPYQLVELPNHPFESDGVEIYAKMLTLLPAANVKSLPGNVEYDVRS
jgi:hypothetical protein